MLVLQEQKPATPLTYILVGDIDMETCQICGSAMKVIACIEDPVVIKKILAHLDSISPATATTALPESRAPPQVGLFDTCRTI